MIRRTGIITILSFSLLIGTYFNQNANAQISQLPANIVKKPFTEVTSLAFRALIPGTEGALIEETITGLVMNEIFPRSICMAFMGANGGFIESGYDPRITFLPEEDLSALLIETGIEIPFEFYSPSLSHSHISAQITVKISDALKLAGSNTLVDDKYLWLGILNGLLNMPEKIVRIATETSALNEIDLIGANHSLLLGISRILSSKNSLIDFVNKDLMRSVKAGAMKRDGVVNPNRFFYMRYSGLSDSLERALVLAYLYHTQVPGVMRYPEGIPENYLRDTLLLIVDIQNALNLKTPGYLSSARASINTDPIAFLEKTKLRVLPPEQVLLDRSEVSQFERLPASALKK